MPANRSDVEQMLAQQGSSPSTPVHKKSAAPARSSAVPIGGRTVLGVVEHEGRRGSLRIKPHAGDKAQVQFADGSYEVLPVSELRLVCWAVQEQWL